MKNTAIIIDTSAPFPPELIKKFGFISVDFKIDWDDQEQNSRQRSLRKDENR